MASTAPPTSGWSEPPWTGWIATTGDALLMLEAARRGVIPRVTRRLVDSERKMIASGSVFVFDEDESGIKRWTDGLFWSPSRILGNFLLYRETDKRGAGHRRAEKQPQQESWEAAVDPDRPDASLSRPKGESNKLGIDRHRERSLVGSLTNSYKFKPNGLMKKTFSLTIAGVSQHLISYYKVEDVESGRLRTPSSIPELSALEISPEYLDKTHFRIPPKVEIGRDGRPRYVGEAEDSAEADPGHLHGGLAKPLLTDVPIALEPATSPTTGKQRVKRYEPYDMVSPGAVSPTLAAKRRKNKGGSISSHPDTASPTSSPGHEASPTLSSPEDNPSHFPYPLPPATGYYGPYPSSAASAAPSYTYPAPNYPGGHPTYAPFSAETAPSTSYSYYSPAQQQQQTAYPGGGYPWPAGGYAAGGSSSTGGYPHAPLPSMAYPGGGPSSHSVSQNHPGDSPTRGG